MKTRAAAKNKYKKPLETTLGKAPVGVADDPIDLSHVRKSIDTSIFGLKEVLRLFETGTAEIRKYVTYECDIMYECRICRSIFRSLANFILHKRYYCRELYHRSDPTNCHNNLQENKVYIKTFEEKESNSFDMPKTEYASGTSSLVPPKYDSKTNVECSHLSNEHSKGPNRKKLDYILGRLQNKQESTLITQQYLSENISNEVKDYQEEVADGNLILEKIDSSNSAVFQTMLQNMVTEYKGSFMKNEVMEIDKILDHNEAILGKDGKIIPSEYERNAKYTCTVCNGKFLTTKTLIYHIRYLHNDTTILYQCPKCRDTFATTRGTYSHLRRVHFLTTRQLRKLRDQIDANAIIRRDKKTKKEKVNNVAKIALDSSSGSQEKADMEDQQWMDYSGDDLKMCGSCGRKFYRKAAQYAHSKFCSKRIKTNNVKRVQTKETQTHDKTSETTKGINLKNSQNIVKGSQRRKPQTTYKLHRSDYVKGIEDTENKVDSKIPQLTSKSKLEEQHNADTEETNSSDEYDVTLPSRSAVTEDEIDSSSIQIESTKIDTKYMPTSSTNIEVEETEIKEDITNIKYIKLPLEINQQFLESNEKKIDDTNETEYSNNKRRHEPLTDVSTSKKIKSEALRKMIMNVIY